MILNTVLEITREIGFEAVNARGIASKLQCSTRPIFTCYENMEELKKIFLTLPLNTAISMLQSIKNLKMSTPVCFLPLSYIEFAKEETNLFKLLFISDMDFLDMTEASDFYKELGNEEKAKAFSKIICVPSERGKIIFLDLFLYTHGIAVLTATGKLSFDYCHYEKMLMNFLSVYTEQKTESTGV